MQFQSKSMSNKPSKNELLLGIPHVIMRMSGRQRRHSTMFEELMSPQGRLDVPLPFQVVQAI